ncbi:hypothetical protein A2U01_0033266, partial [Trifolium medium]|nr:hypothetical protein [Trifolium medium]
RYTTPLRSTRGQNGTTPDAVTLLIKVDSGWRIDGGERRRSGRRQLDGETILNKIPSLLLCYTYVRKRKFDLEVDMD